MFDQIRVADAANLSIASNADTLGSEDLNLVRKINKSKSETLSMLPPITIVDNNPAQPTVRKVEDDAVVMQKDDDVLGIKYKNGQSRKFGWENGEVTSIHNPDGTEFTKTSDGNWINGKGSDAAITNVRVDKSGRLSYEDTKNGDLVVIGTNGKTDKVDLPDDFSTYPDNNHRQGEVDRITKILAEENLTKSGLTTVADMHKLGLDEVDIWHGSYVSVSGDAGSLYQKWSQLPGAHKRDSSHEHIGQQYQIDLGVGDGVVLFGIGPDGNTFFQVEHHASHEFTASSVITQGFGRTFGNWFSGEFTLDDDHGRDKKLFDKIHQNIGKLGISPYIDKNPLKVDWHPNFEAQNYA